MMISKNMDTDFSSQDRPNDSHPHLSHYRHQGSTEITASHVLTTWTRLRGSRDNTRGKKGRRGGKVYTKKIEGVDWRGMGALRKHRAWRATR